MVSMKIIRITGAIELLNVDKIKSTTKELFYSGWILFIFRIIYIFTRQAKIIRTILKIKADGLINEI